MKKYIIPSLIALTSCVAISQSYADDFDNYLDTIKPNTSSMSKPNNPWYPESGFYVEAKIGQTTSSSTNYNFASINNESYPSSSDNLGNSSTYGLELGYRINPYLRVSLSYDNFSNFSFDDNVITPPEDGGVYNLSGSASSQVILINSYLDLNGFKGIDLGRFNPYLGAGVGLSFNKTGDISEVECNAPGWVATFPSNTNTSFAAQISLGVQFAVTKSLSIDLGDRYYWIGEFTRSNVGYTNSSSGNNNGDTQKGSNSATNTKFNTVYFGITYNF